MYTISSLKHKADYLFWIFEEFHFQNTGNYPRKTNLVLEFYDFIQNSTKEDLEKYITFSSNDEFLLLKKIINSGIDAWLDAGDVKTLLLSD
jgi:hypothetical protein